MLRRKTYPTNRGLRLSRDSKARLKLVGRLTPQIGDYDIRREMRFVRITGRKTYPTNRGLRQYDFVDHLYDNRSEDLPHKSGITTHRKKYLLSKAESEDLPHKSGITTVGARLHRAGSESEDLPHKSGITTEDVCSI